MARPVIPAWRTGVPGGEASTARRNCVAAGVPSYRSRYITIDGLLQRFQVTLSGTVRGAVLPLQPNQHGLIGAMLFDGETFDEVAQVEVIAVLADE